MSDLLVEHSPNRTEQYEVKSETSNPRQQSKIIKGILHNDPGVIGEYAVQLKPHEREDYLKKVSGKYVGETQYREFLSDIQLPIAYERDEKNPVALFDSIAGDRQMKGIVAHFTRGSLQERDDLSPQDLYAFVRKEFPNALDYQKNIGKFLDQIESANGKHKRMEYENTAENFGEIVYGKQWEYLKQIQLLEEAARDDVGSHDSEKNDVQDAKKGLEQAVQFNREHRIKGKVDDGYKDGGRAASFDDEGGAVGAQREVIVVNREKDERLQEMIAQAKDIQSQYGSGLRSAFELSKLVFQRMDDPMAVQVVRSKYESRPGEEVLLGDITKENGAAGVCRHRSLLFQVLSSEAGIDTSLVRGNVSWGEYDVPGGHAWNELDVYGRKYLVDIMNPPNGREFGTTDFSDFMKQGGFPEIGVNRFDVRYMDVKGKELYRV